MADISVNGWIAEGGHTIIEGKKNNIILFDIVENLPLFAVSMMIYTKLIVHGFIAVSRLT